MNSTLKTPEVTNRQPKLSATRTDENCNCLRKLLNCLCCKYQNRTWKESQNLVTTEAVTGHYCLTNPTFAPLHHANSDDTRAAFTPTAVSADTSGDNSLTCSKPEDVKQDQPEPTPGVMRNTGANQSLQADQSALAREGQDDPTGVEVHHKEVSRRQNKRPSCNSMFKRDNGVQGLSDLEKQDYFRKIFGNEKNAAEAFKHVEQNGILYSLCASPSYCAIICASLVPFFTHHGRSEGKPPVTITHLLSTYLCNVLRTHCSQIKDKSQLLRKIGEFAMFEVGGCRQKFRQSDFQSSTLAGIIEKDHSATGVAHTFLQPPVEDFMTAVRQFLTTDHKDLVMLIEKQYSEKEGQPVAFLRFLFGLCSAISSHLLEEFSGPFPAETTYQLIRFLKSRIEVDIQSMDNEQSKIDLLNTLYYLYESQNEELARATVGSAKQLAFGGWNPLKLTLMDCTAVTVGLELCDTVEELNLNRCHVEDDGMRRLLPVLHKCKVLRLNENKLGDSVSKGLFATLSRPDCKIRTLELWDNHFTNVSAEHLASALSINRTLEVLVLSHNRLGDSGARRLSAGMRDPGCKIMMLRLDCNDLTDACAEDIASSIVANWSLMGLDLDRNSFTDKSIAPFTRLIKTNTRLKWIRLAGNRFTVFGKRQLDSLQLSRAELEVWV